MMSKYGRRWGRMPLTSFYSAVSTAFIWILVCAFFPLNNAVLTTTLLLIAAVDMISTLAQIPHFSLFSLSRAQHNDLVTIIIHTILITTLSLLLLYMLPPLASMFTNHFPTILIPPALPYLASTLWLVQDHKLRHIIPIETTSYDTSINRQSITTRPFATKPFDTTPKILSEETSPTKRRRNLRTGSGPANSGASGNGFPTSPLSYGTKRY